MAAAFREIYGEDLPPPGRGPVDPREPVARLPEPGPRVPVVQDVIDTPELQVARAAVADSPDLRVMDDEGLEVNARELLSRADEGVNRAQVDSKAYAAAVACFMRFGV